MKMLKRVLSVTVMLIMLMVGTCYAETKMTWEELSEGHAESVLLTDGQTSAKDTTQGVTRGKILSTSMLEITNNEDGTLHIAVDTYAHKIVDKIYQTVFLDKWDESEERWVQIDHWDFERSIEEEADLSYYHVGFTVTGCELNRYYRARAMHLVELDGIMEGKATETNGVLLTDHEV